MRQRIAPMNRAGFSLVELLVVIAIIGVLVGMVAPAVMNQISRNRMVRTQELLRKLDGQVRKQWALVVQRAQSSQPPEGVVRMAGGNDAIARAIWVKCCLKAEFPTTYAEAIQPFAGNPYFANLTLDATSYYRKQLGNRTQANDPNTESAALLLLALQRPLTGMTFKPDEVLGPSAMKDTDGDGLAEITDVFGRPVLLARWGTASPDLDGLNRTARNQYDRDTEDVSHALMNRNVNWDVNEFRRQFHEINGSNNQARSWYTQPTIVSTGKDGQLGIDPRTLGVLDPRYAADNIYSYREAK